MKVTLDLSDLLQKRQITKAEHDRLLALSKVEQQNHFAHILKVFEVMAIVAGLLALAPNEFGAFFTVLSEALGISALLALESVLAFAGALRLPSGFLATLSYGFVIALVFTLSKGGSDANKVAILVLIVSAALAILALELSGAWGRRYERIFLIYARVAFVGAQLSLAFLSLFEVAYAGMFSLFWAISLLALGWWGAKEGRRFVVNTVACFGAALFFVRYFGLVGSSPPGIIGAGVLAIFFASMLLRYNRNA